MLENAFRLDLSELPQVNMEFLDLIVNSDGGQPTVLIMIQDHSPEMISHTLRLYKLKGENGGFVIDYEIKAFEFPTHETAVSFSKRLLDMKAIEILSIIAEKSQPVPPILQ